MLTNKFEDGKHMLVNRAGGLLHRKASVFGPQSRQKLTLKAGYNHLEGTVTRSFHPFDEH